jgi:hypothetical protein
LTAATSLDWYLFVAAPRGSVSVEYIGHAGGCADDFSPTLPIIARVTQQVEGGAE